MSIRLHLFSKRHKQGLKTSLQKTSRNLKLKLLIQNPYMLVGIMILTLIPFLLFFAMDRFRRLEKNERQFQELTWRAEKLSKTLKNRTHFFSTYQNADPLFLSHHVENLVFLESEIEALNVIYRHPAFQSCPAVKERLTRLTKGDNHLSFAEKGREASSFVEELYLKQEIPVEVNGEDLKKILSHLEGLKIGIYESPAIRPQIVIHSFDLKRDMLFGRECYFLEMDLIKREPLIRG